LTSASRVLPISPRLLETNLRGLEYSPRGYSPHEFRLIARSIEDVYRRMDAGADPHELLALRESNDPRERRVGDAYLSVFRGSESSHPLRADVVDGRLIVDSGNHRIRAAQELRLCAVPVEVRARSQAELDRVEAQNAAAVGYDYGRLREQTDRAAFGYEREGQPEVVRAAQTRINTLSDRRPVRRSAPLDTSREELRSVRKRVDRDRPTRQ
jgi:hypothetical protein